MKKERKKITYCTTPDFFRSIHMYARSLIELQKGCQIVLCVGINRLLAPPIFLTQGFSFFFFFKYLIQYAHSCGSHGKVCYPLWNCTDFSQLLFYSLVTRVEGSWLLTGRLKKHAVRLHISLKTSPTKHRSTQSTSVLRFSHWNWYHVRYTHCL